MKVPPKKLVADIQRNAGTNPSAEKLYITIMEAVNKAMKQMEPIVSQKRLYYISAEFLLGKMLTSNLIHMGAWKQVQTLVEGYGYTWQDIQNVEKEPSLGNGGLGRLAACFLDSIAELGLPGDGIGLYYHFGLFEQKFKDHKQQELPNAWIQKSSWFEKIPVDYQIQCNGYTLQPIRYDMDIIGDDGKKNRLHLFDVESVDESIVQEGISFDKTDIAHNLTLFLYPDDSDEKGKLLRVYQQYFMVSCAAHMILEEEQRLGHAHNQLDKHVVIQINDTHPSLIIPELIYLLMQEGIRMKDAIKIVSNTCAYTNHTILAEALETWPMSYLETVAPHLVDILHALDAVADQRDPSSATALIDEEGRMHMAHMDIHFGKSVNGVAAVHTDILKNSELRAFYKRYSDKFNNKTNGITFTRWLHACNAQLYDYLMELLQMDAWEDAALIKLLDYEQDMDVVHRLQAIKREKKLEWCSHMWQKQQVSINPNSIFDTQVKRMHEYKRQQMNALWIIYKMKEIRKGHFPSRPITCIFGAKAAPAYTIAKDIIHILLCLQDIIAHDPIVSPHLQVCFIENYNVSEAEYVIPASDISEQISLASKEASGTGNMKFMLNGALTLGTRDGANVEIAELVGEEHIYMFGKSSEEVIAHYEKQDYCSRELYESDALLQELIDYLSSEEMLQIGDEECILRFVNELLRKDWFMTLLDTREYIVCKEQMLKDYEDRDHWGVNMLYNIANSAYFSSRRTIQDYNMDIWHLG